jgi:hypothetical protein
LTILPVLPHNAVFLKAAADCWEICIIASLHDCGDGIAENDSLDCLVPELLAGNAIRHSIGYSHDRRLKTAEETDSIDALTNFNVIWRF